MLGNLNPNIDISDLLPTGIIANWSGSEDIPSGWLVCNGQEIDKTQYADLSSIIEETYGSYTDGAGQPGTTHARLPDLRDNISVSSDNMANVLTDNNTLGDTAGTTSHIIITNEMGNHNHSINEFSHSHSITSSPHNHSRFTKLLSSEPNGSQYGLSSSSVGFANRVMIGAAVLGPDTKVSKENSQLQVVENNVSTMIQNSGSSTPHNNMQPYLVTNFIIKA